MTQKREACKYSCGDFCLAESLQARVAELEARLAANGEPDDYVAVVNHGYESGVEWCDGNCSELPPAEYKTGTKLYPAAPQATPDGWVLVPVELIDAMVQVIENEEDVMFYQAEGVYKAMLQAAKENGK